MAQKQDASTGDYVDDGVKKDHQKELHIKVYSPFKVYFDGYASSLTAVISLCAKSTLIKKIFQ
jgi:hypothetical protein